MSTGQLNWRAEHSTILVRNKLYCWGGNQKGLPLVHDSEDKRKITSSVNIFELATFKWERKSTTSNPPAGVMRYACTNIMNNMLYFGGCCKVFDCYHNNLYELNTLTLNWNEIITTTTDNIPMRKRGCGMISFNMNGEDHLFLSGGAGPTPLTKQRHAQYIPSPKNPNLSYTNEIHCMNVTTSPGQWIVPVITGTRPPPLACSTSNTLPGNSGVIFGGLSVNEKNRYYSINDVYIFQYSHNTIDFQKIVQSDTIMKWPKERSQHATSIINSISSNQQVTSHLITIGGYDDDLQPLNDCWTLNISSLIWYQINLPQSVSKRFDHSITPYQVSNNRVWIIINGGIKDFDRSRGGGIPVTGCDVIIILELEYINEEWIMKHVWNNEQLMNNKNEIQKSLIHYIVDDRLQEGTLVTDLISLLKSPFTTPQQLETQRILEKKIFEKESELLKLSVEMRENSDEITHLKTREMSLIDKSDTLEKELSFVKDETQIYKKMAITTRQELQEYQSLLMIEKKTSLVKTQELDFSRKQITDLKGTHKHTSTVSSDKKDMKTREEKKHYQKHQEEKLVEEKQFMDTPEPDNISTDKLNILHDEIESLQMIVTSKDVQVEELQSMLKKQNSELEEFMKIEELRISSSHDSEVIKYQRDAAVQFSYMIPVTDHLDGVHVAGETLFLIQGDKPQSLNWEEYGFRLHFPQGAISPSDTCEVVVKALVGGKFQFPEGTELVSAVYAVAFAKKLLEPIEMEIQHCVLLTNDEQGKSLSFVSTAKNLRDNPKKFEFVEGGVFYPGKRYASIQRKHYCENAIVEKTTPPPPPPSPPPNTTTPPPAPPPPPPSDENESSGDDDIVKAKQLVKNKRCYTGQIYYERKGYNKWQMKFIVVRDIDAFVKYISTTYPNCEEDQVIRFTFLDPVDGYIELALDDMDQVTSQGWKIEPHMEPLILMKRDVDLYGSQDIKLPPSCLLTVWTESSLNPETRLSHALPLSGIDCKTRKIYVRRFLEKVDPSSISESTSHVPMTIQIRDTTHHTYNTSNTDIDRSTVDTKQVIRCIKELMRTYHPDLSELFEGVLKTVSSEMYGVGLIPHAVEKNPTFDGIMTSFLSGFVFKDELVEIEEHCAKFLSVFYKIGGPFVYAANKIKRSIQKTVIDKLGVQLNI